MRTRLAPTPSGFLHAGNAINFLVTAKLARVQGATVLLRIDDLDAERVRPEFVADVFDSLAWLGIEWQEGPRNSEELATHWSQQLRLASYDALLAELLRDGHLYACDHSRTEMATCACRDHGLSCDAPEVLWRLRVPSPCLIEVDGAMIDLATVLPDPVLRGRNGRAQYQVASLCDDLRFGIDLIVRGEDLLPSTACQLYIARLLGLEAFARVRFVHHPLITDASGSKLSKSAGADSLKAMREAGMGPGTLHAQATALLARLTARH